MSFVRICGLLFSTLLSRAPTLARCRDILYTRLEGHSLLNVRVTCTFLIRAGTQLTHRFCHSIIVFPTRRRFPTAKKTKRERDVCSVFSRGFSPDTHPSHSSSLYATTSFCFFTVKHIHTYTCECTCTHTIDRPIVPVFVFF